MRHHDFLCFGRLALVPDAPIVTFLYLVASVPLIATKGFFGRSLVTPKNVLNLDFISHPSFLEGEVFDLVMFVAWVLLPYFP